MLNVITKQDYIKVEERFFSLLSESLSKDLLLYCVTGSLARDEIIPRWSDIDVLLVVKKCDLLTLSKIDVAAREAQNKIKIGITFYSLSEFNNLLFKDSKTYLAVKFINEKHYIPRILSLDIKNDLPSEEILKHNDVFEFTTLFLHLKRELLEKDIRDERKVYKLVITILKIALRYRGINTHGYEETITRTYKNLPNFNNIHIPDPKEILAKPDNILERYKTYVKIVEWIAENIDILF